MNDSEKTLIAPELLSGQAATSLIETADAPKKVRRPRRTKAQMAEAAQSRPKQSAEDRADKMFNGTIIAVMLVVSAAIGTLVGYVVR